MNNRIPSQQKPEDGNVGSGSFEKAETVWAIIRALQTPNHEHPAHVLEFFCEKTSLHGFLEVIGSKDRVIKIFWLVVILASVVISGQQVHKLATKYLDGPIVIRVTLKKVVDFNVSIPYHFCMENLLSLQSLARLIRPLDLSESAFLELVASMISAPKFPINFETSFLNHSATIMRIRSFTHPFQLIEAALNNTVLRAMANPNATCSPKALPEGPLCCVGWIPATEYDFERYRLPDFEAISETWRWSVGDKDSFFVGEDADFHGEELSSVGINGLLIFFLSVVRTSRIDRKDQPCRAVEAPRANDVKLCYRTCMAHQCAAETGCYFAGYFNKLPLELPPCNMKRNSKLQDWIDKKEQSNSEVYRNCFNSCPPPCDEISFRTQVRRIQNTDEPKSLVYFVVDQTARMHEESSLLTWETWIANIGGVLGLWLGASVLSFFQIPHYLCLEPLARRMAQRKSVCPNQSI